MGEDSEEGIKANVDLKTRNFHQRMEDLEERFKTFCVLKGKTRHKGKVLLKVA